MQMGNALQNIGSSGWSHTRITFSQNYNTKPYVFITATDQSNTNTEMRVNNITTDGFDWYIYRETDENFTFYMNWIAFGK